MSETRRVEVTVTGYFDIDEDQLEFYRNEDTDTVPTFDEALTNQQAWLTTGEARAEELVDYSLPHDIRLRYVDTDASPNQVYVVQRATKNRTEQHGIYATYDLAAARAQTLNYMFPRGARYVVTSITVRQEP